MIGLDDLDTAAGLESWRQCCNTTHACTPALRFYTAQAKAGGTLRQAIEGTPAADKKGDGWLIWALVEFGDKMEPAFRLWLMQQSITDEGMARHLYYQYPHASEAESTWLFERATETGLFPEMKQGAA